MAPFRYLLDTNILSALIKQPTGTAAGKIATLDDEKECCTSLIDACALRYGTHGSAALRAKVDQLLDTIAVLPLEESIIVHYAEIRVELKRVGATNREQ